MESRLEGVTFVKGESDFLQEIRLAIKLRPRILFDTRFFIFQNICEANVNIKTIKRQRLFFSLNFLSAAKNSGFKVMKFFDAMDLK